MMKSLYVKFAVTTITIMLISGLFSFMFSNFYYQQKLKPYNDEKNTKIALDIADYVENEKGIHLERYLKNIANVGYQLFLIDKDGNETFYGNPFREKSLSDRTINLVLDGEVYHGIADFPQETFVTGFFANELTNTIGIPLEHNNKQYALFIRPNIKLLFNEMHILFAWLLALTILLSIIFVLISTKYLVNPISKLTTATNKLSEGNFSIKLDIDREDEIGKLAKSFTNMAEQLEMLDVMKNEFISNVSHDIQSPLSNIKGYSNLLEKDTLSKGEKDLYVSIINNEINRLSSLTKQLLLLASLDRGEDILKEKTYDLSEQLKEVVFNHQWSIDEKGIMIGFSLSEIHIKGDPSLLYNVWENLLTNAIKYNKENGTIDIAIIENETNVEVRFQDSGIGLSEEVRERIFDRFYREDSSRTRAIEGTGLGLSIVSSIVTLHGGRIEIDSKENEGSTFTVYLPKR
ncbi:MAG TPA: HAMP domain-containing sensor histidine kinase [Candidatus Avamphibacillus sp.]|nr:HAMP domain-containing sensor histidine kinase [Candidatus Avamphibacillus sp.]